MGLVYYNRADHRAELLNSYFVVLGGVAIKPNLDIDFMSNFSDFLDLSYFPPVFVFGVNIVSLLEFFNEIIVFDLVGVLSEHDANDSLYLTIYISMIYNL
jgi:hypothetical protein